jgi:segregation and condensation protein A
MEPILKLIIEKESWEEILYHIVSVQNLDPWDIDLVRLADGFISFLRQAEQLDFRVPAKVVFIAAILLRLKAERLAILEFEEEGVKQEQGVELDFDVKGLKLARPFIRLPKRQITIEELVHALRKALRAKERRELRGLRWRSRLEAEIELEEDVTRKIEMLMAEIDELLSRLKRRIRFRELVGEWNRQRIVECLVPVLHLEQAKRIKAEQEDFFEEIWISKQAG